VVGVSEEKAAAVDNAAGTEQPSGEERRTGIAGRFRGFLPVIVDVETGGFNPAPTRCSRWPRFSCA